MSLQNRQFNKLGPEEFFDLVLLLLFFWGAVYIWQHGADFLK
jgi:hypothetical protein